MILSGYVPPSSTTFRIPMQHQSLATFLRKRDPRYKAHLAAQAAAASSTASTPKSARTPTTRPTPPSSQSEFVAQDWQKAQKISDAEDLEWAAAENEQEEWECVACGKTFRSEAAWDSHERSRKHLKAVEDLRKRMREESEELGLGEVDEEDEEERGSDEEYETYEDPPETPIIPSEAGEIVDEPAEAPALDADSGEEDPESENSTERATKGSRATPPGTEGGPPHGDGETNVTQPTSKAKTKGKQPRAPSPEVLTKSQRRAKARNESASAAASASGPPSVLTAEPEDHTPHEAAESTSTPTPQPELSKRDKRRAREAAKAARAETMGPVTAKEASTHCAVKLLVYSRCFSLHSSVTFASRSLTAGRSSLRISRRPDTLLQPRLRLTRVGEVRRRARKARNDRLSIGDVTLGT